ncbi:AraC family transcriptional regulator [Paenibacillus roseipurpureus]|uniref:AraC family transcriptional regulator n=1 Tax=Paenibacillus roseopurpureus TaxID=2918901 RepID=A0AA96LML2_9BACL|nr:AraC family transcriptional regulator [Paenibacillus sp. MBLB1832]WNR43331.1 AraC family transcriptional regulator [Paenibacillus sp. MBLB1832]
MLLNRLHAPSIVPFIRECDYAVRKPWSYPERRLLDYLLVYIQEGTCCFWVDHQKLMFYPGQFCLVQPGSLLVLEGLTRTVTPYLHFDIAYNVNREDSFPTRPGQIDLSAYTHLMQPTIYDLFGIRVPVNVQPQNPSIIKEKLLQTIELVKVDNPISHLKAQHAMLEIIISILEAYQRDVPSPTPTLNWITSYFSSHLSDPISVEDMAERANLSVSRFSFLFKQRYGTSPHQYLLQMRIHHAKELLSNTELSHESISDYCGFADLHHFSKIFKQRTGTTPGEHRKTTKNPFNR